MGVPASPTKADTPLIVYSNTVLTLAATDELLEAIRRRNPKVVYCPGGIQNQELSQCHSLDPTELSGPPSEEYFFGLLAAEPFDHALIITHYDIIVKRY